jgi:hypothetical protein
MFAVAEEAAARAEAAKKQAATTIQKVGRVYLAWKKAAVGTAAKKAAEAKKAEAEAKKVAAEAKKAEAKKVAAEEAATTKIQAAFRKHKAKQDFANKKQAATTIQASVRGLQAQNAFKQKKAAIAIQKVGRGYLARQEAKKVAAEAAATTIQKAARGLIARKAFAKKKEAATTIQKVGRVYLAKKEAAEKEKEATIIQENSDKSTSLKMKLSDTEKKVRELLLFEKGKLERQQPHASNAAPHVSNTEQLPLATTEEGKTKREKETLLLESVALYIKSDTFPQQGKKDSEPASELSETEATDETEALSGKAKPELMDAKNAKRPLINSAAVVRSGRLSKATLKEGDEEKEDINQDPESTENESDDGDFYVLDAGGDFDENDAIHSSTYIQPTARLNSGTMRECIKKLGEFKESELTFESGGVTKPAFFYEKNSNSGEKTYVALACNKEPGDRNAQCSGEQSISIVLQNIIDDLNKDKNTSNAKILIPLQQIGKQHWTLLAIMLTKKESTSGNDEYTAEATHYDSKGLLNKTRDLWSVGKKYVDKCVKDNFPDATVEYKYSGEQGLLDHHNCGRYTLIKLLALINSDQPHKKLATINDMINPGPRN